MKVLVLERIAGYAEPNETVEVSKEMGESWIERGIAKPVKEEKETPKKIAKSKK
jgi:hypothetical protein